jgi:putative SOS response-associated peptidase YedK
MCYDISYRINLQTLEDYFGDLVFDDPQMEMDFDLTEHVIAQAYKKYPVVLFDEGVLKCKMFEWGLISKGMKTPDVIKKRRNSMCNAQSERIVQDKISAWHSIRHQRCLIPVNGIFEHRAIKGWKNKVPYYVRLKNRPMFCIPGLYNYPPTPQNIETGEATGTYTLITRAANSVMRQIHNDGDNAFRMPLFLPKELETEWLDPTLTDGQIQEILDFEMPAEELEYYPVWSIRSTKPHPNGGRKTDRFDWPNLPPLGQDDGEIQKALFQ